MALCLATETFAHASLVSAEPADGSVVAQAPKTVQLQFNESVTPAVVSLIDAGGRTREVTVRAVDQSVVIVLPEDLPQERRSSAIAWFPRTDIRSAGSWLSRSAS